MTDYKQKGLEGIAEAIGLKDDDLELIGRIYGLSDHPAVERVNVVVGQIDVFLESLMREGAETEYEVHFCEPETPDSVMEILKERNFPEPSEVGEDPDLLPRVVFHTKQRRHAIYFNNPDDL